jgi:hypothetical protein
MSSDLLPMIESRPFGGGEGLRRSPELITWRAKHGNELKCAKTN